MTPDQLTALPRIAEAAVAAEHRGPKGALGRANRAKAARPKKRKLSAAGHKRTVQATNKGWEAVSAQKAAAQEASVKVVKKTKKRTGSTGATSAAPEVGRPGDDLE